MLFKNICYDVKAQPRLQKLTMREACVVPSRARLTWFFMLTILVELAMASGHVSIKFTDVEV